MKWTEWTAAACAVVISGGCDPEPLAALPARVVGTICDPATGAPAPNLAYELRSTTTAEVLGNGTTDGAGRLSLDAIRSSGPAELVSTFGDQTRAISLQTRSGETVVVLDPACRDVPPLPGTGDIVGVICDRHVGGLVTNASVTAVLANGDTLSTTTDDDGAFGLWNVPAGEVVVAVVSETYRRSFAVVVVEGEATEIPGAGCTGPVPGAGLVSGVLCDPLDDATVLVGALVSAVDENGDTYTDRVDVDGRFVLGPMAPGRAVLTVTPDVGEGLSWVVQVVAGEEIVTSNGGVCADETCAEVVVEAAAPETAELVLVVDRSGSMNAAAPGYGTTRWLGVKDALVSVTAELQSRVAFGLALFPSPGEEDTCSVGDDGAVVLVEPEVETAAAIALVLDGFDTEPLGATPTAAALVAARAWLQTHPSSRPRAVLLATDGGPNCNEGLDPLSCRCSSGQDQDCVDAAFTDPTLAAQLCLDDRAAIAAVATLRADNVSTFIVGIPGVENFSDVLRSMASAGGTLLPGPTGFYLARDRATLQAAIVDIGRRVSGCSVDILDFDIQGAGRVDVTIDGAPIVRHINGAGDDGFDIVDEDTIVLFGPACEAWRDGASVQITRCTPTLETSQAGGTP
jgi:hypothetical protein